MKKLVNIGLDIGISTVGVGVVDVSHNPIFAFTHRFKQPVEVKTWKLENQNRREKELLEELLIEKTIEKTLL